MLVTIYDRIDSDKRGQSENAIHDRMLVDLRENLIETWYMISISEIQVIFLISMTCMVYYIC